MICLKENSLFYQNKKEFWTLNPEHTVVITPLNPSFYNQEKRNL